MKNPKLIDVSFVENSLERGRLAIWELDGKLDWFHLDYSLGAKLDLKFINGEMNMLKESGIIQYIENGKVKYKQV